MRPVPPSAAPHLAVPPAEMLCHLLDMHPDPARRRPVPDLPGTAWHALVAEAIRHGVAPLLCDRLRSLPVGSGVPAGARATLADVAAFNRLRTRGWQEELASLLAACAREGLAVIVLKGAHLATLIYADAALRPMGDLDLLAKPADVGRIARLMYAQGYRMSPAPADAGAPQHHLPAFRKAGSLPVEIHHALGPLHSDTGDLWTRAHPARIAGSDALVLAPEDLMLHLCRHVAYGHRFAIPLLWLCDIAAAAQRHGQALDWPEMAARARDDRPRAVVRAVLELVRHTVGLPAPDGALDAFPFTTTDRAAVTTIRQYVLGPVRDAPVVFAQLRHGRGLRHRLRVLVAAAFPPAARLRRLYGLAPNARCVRAYYVVRLMDLAVRHAGTACAALLDLPRARRAGLHAAHRADIEEWLTCGGTAPSGAGRSMEG